VSRATRDFNDFTISLTDICRTSVGNAALCIPLEECEVFDKLILTRIGTIIENYLLQIEHHYNHVKLIKYVIIPNHIHLILLFDYNGMQGAVFPTIVT